MRLDTYLSISRLVVRRTLANKLCEAGKVMLNGLPAKAAKEVRPGDEIVLNGPTRSTHIRIVNVPVRKQVAKAEASDLYELIRETRAAPQDPLA